MINKNKLTSKASSTNTKLNKKENKKLVKIVCGVFTSTSKYYFCDCESYRLIIYLHNFNNHLINYSEKYEDDLSQCFARGQLVHGEWYVNYN